MLRKIASGKMSSEDIPGYVERSVREKEVRRASKRHRGNVATIERSTTQMYEQVGSSEVTFIARKLLDDFCSETHTIPTNIGLVANKSHEALGVL
jgi:hypothetical protein